MEVCLCLELESVYEYLLMRAQVAMSKALELFRNEMAAQYKVLGFHG